MKKILLFPFLLIVLIGFVIYDGIDSL